MHRCFKFLPSICTSWSDCINFLYFFGTVRFTSAQLASSPFFPLPDVASPPADIATPPRHVTLPSYWAKMSSLHPLHLPIMLYPIVFPLELKLKYWICTTTTGYPPQTAGLPPSTTIKRSFQLWSLTQPLNRASILAPPYLEHHAIGAPPTVVFPFHRYLTPIIPLHNDTYGDELADPLSFPE
jgi:hypothetical protein